MNHTYVLAVHGGSGTIIPGSSNESGYHEALQAALVEGEKILKDGGSAVEAVLASSMMLEDCPLFNAGRGSVYTSAGTHEMDASIMNGRTLAAGAVAGVHSVRNPVLLAHTLMLNSSHVFVAGEGAERFAREYKVPLEIPQYFATPERIKQLEHVRGLSIGNALLLDHDAAWHTLNNTEHKFGTVGAVARDRSGQLAAATSTGGLTNKMLGRVGDSPIIGAGCYADSETVAVSATGTGEHFIRTVLAYDIAARIKYGRVTLEEAAHQAIFNKLTQLGGEGGVIAIDKEGNIAMPFNTRGMYRGWIQEGKDPITAVGPY
ncbi:MAG: isoaspartyl peptidase/L-asparaginase [Pseudomonadota bacterium]